ncbi:MAG: hypothetical protein CVU52_12005, partial [Deltaproteobacteria bacterium HGW-Deltaproteobacteria-10]
TKIIIMITDKITDFFIIISPHASFSKLTLNRRDYFSIFSASSTGLAEFFKSFCTGAVTLLDTIYSVSVCTSIII